MNTIMYASVFYEGQHNDARTNIAVALTASLKGAAIANHTQVVDFLFDSKTGKCNGVLAKDTVTGAEFKVHAREIILCGGAFTDAAREKLHGGAGMKPAVQGAGGTHIVLPGYVVPRNMGMVGAYRAARLCGAEEYGDGRRISCCPAMWCRGIWGW